MKENTIFRSRTTETYRAFSFWKVFYSFIVAALCLVQPLLAQNIDTDPRYALVIGNGNYRELGKLKNPKNDATDMAEALRKLNFDVELLIDADLVSMENGVNRLGAKLATSPKSMGFFFYAGHGVQSNGVNYLIPSDAYISDEVYLRTKALAVQSILDTFQGARNELNVIVLDACRDNPFGWARTGTRGLSVVGSQPTGSIIVYATGAGSVAMDGSGRNGVFTQELLKHIQTPGLEIKEIFNRTGAAVQAATSGKQVPAVYSQFFGSAYLAGSSVPPNIETPRMATVGKLNIISNEREVRVVIDGADKGTLGDGIFQGLPAGERRIELVGKDVYFERTVTIRPNETTQIVAELVPVGSIDIKAPADARTVIRSVGYSNVVLGSSVLTRVPVGTYYLEASGGDYFDTSTTISVGKGERAVWEPYATGAIDFDVRPEGTTCILSDPAAMSSMMTIKNLWGTIENLSPGKYHAVLKQPGYHDKELDVTVTAGKVTTITADLVPFTPGTIVLPRLGVAVDLEADGQPLQSRAGFNGQTRYEVPSGYPVTVKFIVPGAESKVPDMTVSLDEGETVMLDLPAGRFTLPWLSPDSCVYIAGQSIFSESLKSFRSPLLPVGTYQVSVMGKYAFDGWVTIKAHQETELPGYRDSMVTALYAERSEMQKTLSARKTKTTWGFVSLGAGILGAAGAIRVYELGIQAGKVYDAAVDTASAQSARKQVELYGVLFPVAAVAGGLGFGLSSSLLSGGPDPKALQQSIDMLDEQLKALGK